ncbi:hypothetical protein M407DRAFT_155574 [Tulasnella calospora MUT 4182]|uniref:Uncharacterized protein n=1 Tax=Tulasnella calospora MUT 4182 TaxID=1051891 RepID=A0A0C3QRG6_9AGAM|nr:hypothetical protein M407DRAFT_155574 [Tulasnella calospora MUT 4182]
MQLWQERSARCTRLPLRSKASHIYFTSSPARIQCFPDHHPETCNSTTFSLYITPSTKSTDIPIYKPLLGDRLRLGLIPRVLPSFRTVSRPISRSLPCTYKNTSSQIVVQSKLEFPSPPSSQGSCPVQIQPQAPIGVPIVGVARMNTPTQSQTLKPL